MSMDDVDLYEVEEPEKKANDKSKVSKLTPLQRDVVDAINKDPKRNYSINNLYKDFMDDATLASDVVADSGKNMSNAKMLSLVKDKYRKIFTNPEDLKRIDKVADYVLHLFRGY